MQESGDFVGFPAKLRERFGLFERIGQRGGEMQIAPWPE